MSLQDLRNRRRDDIVSVDGRNMAFMQACCGSKIYTIKVPTPRQQYPLDLIEWCHDHCTDHFRFEWHGVDRIVKVDGTTGYVEMFAMFYFKDKSDLLRFKLSN